MGTRGDCVQGAQEGRGFEVETTSEPCLWHRRRSRHGRRCAGVARTHRMQTGHGGGGTCHAGRRRGDPGSGGDMASPSQTWTPLPETVLAQWAGVERASAALNRDAWRSSAGEWLPERLPAAVCARSPLRQRDPAAEGGKGALPRDSVVMRATLRPNATQEAQIQRVRRWHSELAAARLLSPCQWRRCHRRWKRQWSARPAARLISRTCTSPIARSPP